MADDDKSILYQMAKQLGMLDSKLDSLNVDLREFKARYDSNAQVNRDHATRVESRINDIEVRKIDRDDPELDPTRKLYWIKRNWPWVVLVVSLAWALGIKVYHEVAPNLDGAKAVIEKTTKGGKLKP